MYPNEPLDFDLGFLISKQGQLYNNEYKDIPENTVDQKK
jgi:hypothetical protein